MHRFIALKSLSWDIFPDLRLASSVIHEQSAFVIEELGLESIELNVNCGISCWQFTTKNSLSKYDGLPGIFAGGLNSPDFSVEPQLAKANDAHRIEVVICFFMGRSPLLFLILASAEIPKTRHENSFDTLKCT